MKTVVESPQRRFRREAGLPEISRGRGYDTGSWMKLNVGGSVYRHDDPRHVGRVEAIHHSAMVKVRWNDTDWVEFVKLSELR